ncbi:hypothetical protein [Butyrivibrio sp. AE2005]|uniref:hypothetical protein n=1 Tax=Butyrivibrio sp. AE2005 TaxID=1496722 RepID=UPI00047EFC6D|nr:hypothetical protein [Butyrivibrio sp. AE2005]
MSQNSRELSLIEEHMSQNVIFETWTQTWGLRVYPAYGIDKIKFGFIKKNTKGKGFDIFMDCLRDDTQCFDNWAYDILHGRFERNLANEKQAGEQYPKTYKYITGKNGQKTLGIMNSKNGGYCINVPLLGKDGNPVKEIKDNKEKIIYINIPVSFHGLRHLAERYLLSYRDRKNELEQLRKEASKARHNSEGTDSSDSAQEPSASGTTSVNSSEKDTKNKKVKKLPTPDTTPKHVLTRSILSKDSKGNYSLKAIDKANNILEFVFPREYWESNKYGNTGEIFKEKASIEENIWLTLHFYVFNQKKYVAEIELCS